MYDGMMNSQDFVTQSATLISFRLALICMSWFFRGVWIQWNGTVKWKSYVIFNNHHKCSVATPSEKEFITHEYNNINHNGLPSGRV